MIVHPFPPLYNRDSKVLILGSFPSVRSREAMFFYGHPQNRFWKVIAALFDEPVPQSIPEKKALILDHGLALWDSIASCEIKGSSDASITDAVPTDLSEILENSAVQRIFCNGTRSFEMYRKYQLPRTGIEAVKLPSTSPANAACSLDKLIDAWKVIGLHTGG
ncbi:MAG: DNA-deoxyinosine glycosylase [Firmicutes bacterium]|nr:DNA-deoxyinosine glycosylase [Bacillota bacterium]